MEHAVDGLSLIWFSDVVFSGGGTMVREAALLGANVYSIFGGKLGSADRLLASNGRLKLIRDPEEIRSLEFTKTVRTVSHSNDNRQTRDFIYREIMDFAYKRSGGLSEAPRALQKTNA